MHIAEELTQENGDGSGDVAYQIDYNVDITNGQESTTGVGIVMTSHHSGQLILIGGIGVSDLNDDFMGAIRVYERLEE